MKSEEEDTTLKLTVFSSSVLKQLGRGECSVRPNEMPSTHLIKIYLSGCVALDLRDRRHFLARRILVIFHSCSQHGAPKFTLAHVNTIKMSGDLPVAEVRRKNPKEEVDEVRK